MMLLTLPFYIDLSALLLLLTISYFLTLSHLNTLFPPYTHLLSFHPTLFTPLPLYYIIILFLTHSYSPFPYLTITLPLSHFQTCLPTPHYNYKYYTHITAFIYIFLAYHIYFMKFNQVNIYQLVIG